MRQEIGFGVIGTGIFGELHCRVYAEHPKVRLVAVCDIDAKRARAAARKYGVKHWFTDYREMLAMEDLAAVSIVTPDFAHKAPAVAAAKAGKHFLLEKPLATTLADARAIAEAAKKAEVTAMVDFHNRWNPAMVKAKEAVDKGRLGEVMMIYYRLSDTREVPLKWFGWSSKTSVLWFLGSHSVDTMMWLLKDEVKRVYAVSRSKVLRGAGVDTPDFYQATLEFRKGACAVLENCWILAESEPSIFDFKLEMVGSKGTIRCDLSHNRVVERLTEKEVAYPDVMVMPEIHGEQSGFAAASIRYFADCIVEGRKPTATLEQGVENVRVLAAIERSAKTGRPVDLAPSSR